MKETEGELCPFPNLLLQICEKECTYCNNASFLPEQKLVMYRGAYAWLYQLSI